MRTIATWILAATAATAAVLVTGGTPAAAATPRNGHCESGEFCLYWGADRSGSVSDFNGSVPNYTPGSWCYRFIGDGLGKGQCVKNNALSAWNNTTGNSVTVFYNSDYDGRRASQQFYPGEHGNFIRVLLDQNASHKFTLL